MISIIVPVYKAEKYLDNCINSLLSQTYTDLEIILVDDGSPDASGAICDAYAAKDSRIKVIHQQNGGQSAARNAGLSVASGEYVGFVDADDTVEPDMYEVLYEAIQGRDLAICGARRVREGQIPERIDGAGSVTELDRDGLWNEVFGRMNNGAWNKLYRKDLLQGCRFLEGLFHNEDLIFLLSYLPMANSGKVISAAKYNYFVREGSVTNKKHFTERAFDEVRGKDMARELVEQYYPPLANVALSYCVIARMNVCRKLYRYGLQSKYQPTLDEYRAFFRQHDSSFKAQLPWRRRVEYFLLCRIKWLYKLLLNLI